MKHRALILINESHWQHIAIKAVAIKNVLNYVVLGK